METKDTNSNEAGSEQAVIEGGLGDMPDVGTETAPNAEANQGAKPVYTSAAGEFGSVEQLADHTRSLEKRLLVDQGLQDLNTRNEAAELLDENHSVKHETNKNSELADLLLTDTEKAVEIIEGRVEQKIRRENSVADSRRGFYDELYSSNPELNHYKDVVNLIVKRDSDELSKMNLPEASRQIKKRTLDFVGAIAQRTGGRLGETEVKGGNTNTLTSSSTETPPAPKPTFEDLSFADQLKRLRAKRAG